jgi:hypothetical protein
LNVIFAKRLLKPRCCLLMSVQIRMRSFKFERRLSELYKNDLKGSLMAHKQNM